MLLKRCSRNRSRKNIILACLIAFIVVTSPVTVLVEPARARAYDFYIAGLYLTWSNTYHSWVSYNGMMSLYYDTLGYDPSMFIYYAYQFADTSYYWANQAFNYAYSGYLDNGSANAYYAALYAAYHSDYKYSSYINISSVYSNPYNDSAISSAIIDGMMANYYCGIAQFFCGLVN